MSVSSTDIANANEALREQKQLQARLVNTERALLALWSLIEDTMPSATQDAVGELMNEYYTTNSDLGADFSLAHGWDIGS